MDESDRAATEGRPYSCAPYNRSFNEQLPVSDERGLGEQLMCACIDEARSAGHETIWLGVWERNARAQAFYRKWNFREVGEHIFPLGSDLQRDIVMERPL